MKEILPQDAKRRIQSRFFLIIANFIPYLFIDEVFIYEESFETSEIQKHFIDLIAEK